MSTFKSVVTTLGQARIAAAIQAGTDIKITQLAVGDGNGKATTPVATQTKLVKEVFRTPLNSLKLDASHANWIIAEAIISASVGGFWMREMGLFADDGTLIAVCNMADTYKPTLAEGSGRTQTLRMVITVSDTEAITLIIDDSIVVATEGYVNDLLAAHEKSRNHPDGTTAAKGFVQLSSSVTSDSETLAATPKAVKAANDNANGRLPSGGTAVAANKLATSRKVAGVAFDGTADISIPPANVGALPAGGTAVAASKLATARNIAGVAFDGTKDISLTPDNVGALPSGGTAVAATKLATARKIAGVAFDGTKDIALTAANVDGLGSAATKDVGNADGNVMSVGAFGVGTDSLNTADANTISKNGFYAVSSAGVHGPLANTAGEIIHIQYDKNSAKQIGWPAGVVNAQMFYRLKTGGVWGDWVPVYDAKHKPTAADVEAVPLTGTTAVNGIVRNSAEFQSTSANAYRIVQGDYGSFWRQDSSYLYLMLTKSGDAYGGYNDLRPLRINLATGAVSFGTGIPVSSDGTISCTGTITPGNYSNFDNRYYTKSQSDAGYMAKTGAYTKSESDGRYIYDVQRGSQALENAGWSAQQVWEAPTGCFMTGLNIRSDLGDCRMMGKYYRALMVRTASGSWRQVGN
jgi:hypothetical protein